MNYGAYSSYKIGFIEMGLYEQFVISSRNIFSDLNSIYCTSFGQLC